MVKNFYAPINEIKSERVNDYLKVSPLEVVGSMANKVGKRIDEGFFGSFARGYLWEQLGTSFGVSGSRFNKTYIENDAMFNSPSKDTFVFSAGLGSLVGVAQDVFSVCYLYDLLNDKNLSTFGETSAIYGGLKFATQLGALAVRRYNAEANRLREEKAKKLNEKI